MGERTTSFSHADALQFFALTEGASAEAIRNAYLEKVRQSPPDRDAEGFEAVRDAYAVLKDPASRAKAAVDASAPEAPLTSILDAAPAKRAFVGLQLWMDALKEKRP